jgi:hypothetical protein
MLKYDRDDFLPVISQCDFFYPSSTRRTKGEHTGIPLVEEGRKRVLAIVAGNPRRPASSPPSTITNKRVLLIGWPHVSVTVQSELKLPHPRPLYSCGQGGD